MCVFAKSLTPKLRGRDAKHCGPTRTYGCAQHERKLMRLGVKRDDAIAHGLSSHNYFRMSRSPVVQQALSNAWLEAQGLVSVKALWCKAQGFT